jgi:hypothetical protein
VGCKPDSTLKLTGAIDASVGGGDVQQCGPTTPTGSDAQTFHLDATVRSSADTYRLRVVIHDGPGGPGTYDAIGIDGPIVYSVYLKDGVSSSDASPLMSSLKSIKGIESVRYVSKEDALAQAASDPDIAAALSALGGNNNPLPASIQFAASDPSAAATALVRARSSTVSDTATDGVRPPVDLVREMQGIAEVAIYPSSTASNSRPDYQPAAVPPGTGHVTLNADERSGSVDAVVVSVAGHQARTVHIYGTFAC